MIKVLVVGLGLALSVGVASAQTKRTPRKAPAGAKKSKAEPKPATPTDPGLAPATPATTPSPSPAATDANAPAPGKPAAPRGDSPTKTDEKANVDEQLQADQTSQKVWVRGVPESEKRTATATFREGNIALNDGLFVEAVAKYREALTHWDHPAIHYNLALGLLNLDQPIEVFDHLNAAIKFGAEPLEKDKYEHAKEYLLLVQKQLADIEVSCDKIGAKVSVDGKEVFVAPGSFKQKVRVGKHTFVGEKQGYNARITAPYIGPGETFRIELKLYTADELTRFRTRWDNRWFPYAVMGGGVLVGLGAGGMYLAAQSDYDKYDKQVAACNTMAAGCRADAPGIKDFKNSGDTKRTLSIVGYSIAGAAIATGAVLAWVNRNQAYQISPEELNEPAPPIAVAPIVSPEMAGAMVQGHF